MAADSLIFRMFVDDVSGFALWGEDGAEGLDELPMSDELRERIQGWGDEYTDVIGCRGRGSRPHAWFLEHDRRGQVLCEELREQVGPSFSVTYIPSTRELRESLKKSR